jgi:hypothetical protein
MKDSLQICYGMSAAGSLRQAGYDYILMFTHDFNGPLQDFKTYEAYENRSHFLQEESAKRYGVYEGYEQMFFLSDKIKSPTPHTEMEPQVPVRAEDFVNIIKGQDQIFFWLSKGFQEHILLSLLIRLFDVYGIDSKKIQIKTVTENDDPYGVKYDIYSPQMKSRDLIIAKSAECTDVHEHFERMSKPGSEVGFSIYRIGRVSAPVLETVQTSSSLTDSQISYFRDAWLALTAPTPEALIQLSHRPNEFYFLEGLREFMDRLPHSKSGLNACEREILNALYKSDQHSMKIGQVVGNIIGKEGYFPMDDSYVYACIKRLSDQHAKMPALVIGPPIEDVDAMYLENITLTDFGRAICAGDANWLEENEIEGDVGGLHVSSRERQLFFSDDILDRF